jgi:hypothetical protein
MRTEPSTARSSTARHRVQAPHARPPPCSARRAGPRHDRALLLDDTATINFAYSTGHLHCRAHHTLPPTPLPSSRHLGCTAPPRRDAADHHNSAAAARRRRGHLLRLRRRITSGPPSLPLDAGRLAVRHNAAVRRVPSLHHCSAGRHLLHQPEPSSPRQDFSPNRHCRRPHELRMPGRSAAFPGL